MPSTDEIPKLDLAAALLETEEERSELDKIFEQMLDPRNIAHNTELNRQEILAFSVLGTLAKRYELQVLKDFLMENLTYRVSKGRAGRKEWIKIIAGQRAQEEPQPGIWDRVMGRKKPEG